MSHTSRQSLKLSVDVMYQHSEARSLARLLERQRVQNSIKNYPCIYKFHPLRRVWHEAGATPSPQEDDNDLNLPKRLHSPGSLAPWISDTVLQREMQVDR